MTGMLGAVRSSTKPLVVGAPTLPAASTDRTANVWSPSAAAERSALKVVVHAPHDEPSIEHSPAESGSMTNVHWGVVTRSGVVGERTIVGGTGAYANARGTVDSDKSHDVLHLLP